MRIDFPKATRAARHTEDALLARWKTTLDFYHPEEGK